MKEASMSLTAKQVIIAIVSVAIVLVLGYVVYTERKHEVVEHRIIVKPDSAGCVRCHGYEDGGGAGSSPGIVKHWEASVHAVQGVGCVDCHGMVAAGSVEDIANPRYMGS
jgi:hypothetical protein